MYRCIYTRIQTIYACEYIIHVNKHIYLYAYECPNP